MDQKAQESLATGLRAAPVLRIPTDEELVVEVRQRPGVALLELAALLWSRQVEGPALWREPRAELGAMTATWYLRVRMRELLRTGAVVLGRYRSGMGAELGLTYRLPGGPAYMSGEQVTLAGGLL